jgi:hypothetical protein
MTDAKIAHAKSKFFKSVEPPWWDDKPVAIIGNGKSILGFDLNRLRGRFYVLAVKGAMFNIPWADAGFGLDTPRYLEWCGMLNTIRYPVYWAAQKVEHFGPGPHAPCVRFIRRIDTSDISDDASAIFSGGSSGFGALNVAHLKHAKRVMLLGYDYDADTRGFADLRAYIETRSQDENRWRTWGKAFDQVKRRFETQGTQIINASPKSRIPTFPKMTIDEAMEEVFKPWPSQK